MFMLTTATHHKNAFKSAFISVKLTALAVILLANSGCTLSPVTPSSNVPPLTMVANQKRIDRALANLADGLKRYEAGNFEEAKTSFLLAVDSGLLTTPQLLNARKHMAFILVLQNREPSAREEFEKAFALDPKFELTPAETGHPAWGPVYRQVKAEIEFSRTGNPVPASSSTKQTNAKQPTLSERAFSDGMMAYEAGDYKQAIKLFTSIEKEALPNPERIKIHKQTAFSYCLIKQRNLCRAEFGKILKLQPAFELEPAEADHPSWKTIFLAAKTASRRTLDAAPDTTSARKK